MSWNLHHVNIPAHDVRAMVRFYNSVFGMNEIQFPWSGSKTEGQLEKSAEFVALFEDGSGRQIHICKPTPSLPWDNDLRLHPVINGHIALQVDDIEAVKERLTEQGAPFNDAGTWSYKGFHQVYTYDPSMNVVEINQRVD